MSDGRIRIDINVDGKEVDVAADSLRGLESSAESAGKGAKKTERGIKDIVVSLGLVKLGSAAFSALSASMDTAIKRFDTMNQFPRVMEQIGFSTEDSNQAINNLRDGIMGLPTPLQDVVSTARGIAVMTKDLDGAVDTTLALNNAFLASGSSSADASRGLDQYLQMLGKGEVDLQSWRTLQETMGLALNDVAEAFGFAGAAAQNDLYEALKAGDVTFDQFNDKIIELSNEVGGFADMAMTGSEGINTSMANIRTAMANGVAGAITAIDELSKEVTGNNIAQNFDLIKDVINAAFKVINNAITASTPFVKAFADVVRDAIPIIERLTPVIGGLAAAYLALRAIEKVNSIIDANAGLVFKAAMSGKELTIVTKGQIAAQAAKTKATLADTTAQVANTGALTLGQTALAVLTGHMKISTAAIAIKTKALGGLKAAITFLTGPIGLVVGGIALLTAGAITLVKWLNRSTAEGERLASETEEMAEATNSMNDALDDSSKQYEKNVSRIESTADANRDLADRITELSDKEHKSAADKKLLSEYVEQLNGQITDLNLSYDEEADMMSLSSEQIAKRLELMKEQEAGTAAQERLLEIAKEQSEVEQQLAETNQLREEWNQKLDEGTVKGKEHSEAVDQLNESQAGLEERQQTLRSEYESTEEQLTVAMENIAAATEDSVGRQTLLFSDLSEAQQAAVESMKSSWESYKTAATDMFDTINEESEITASEMAKNLEENQRIIGAWAENIAKLAERGINEGLLEQLREAGPTSAGHVNALVNASDEELERLSTAFAEGGQVATDALSTSLGIENTDVLNKVGHLVFSTEQALSKEIKNADFESIGGNVAEGLADGIDQSAIEAEKASEGMGEDVKNAAKKSLGINSPSTVFKEFGLNVTEGMRIGIEDGAPTIIQLFEKNMERMILLAGRSVDEMHKRFDAGSKKAVSLMRTTSTEIVAPFSVTPARFRSIGLNSMIGLNDGMNAGRARVMATANNIAANVATTMQRALRIQSPSRVMKDDVGRWIPEGLAAGIDDKAQVVYDAVNNMTGNMMKMTTPELALGSGRMGINSQTSSVVNNSTHYNQSNADNSGIVEALSNVQMVMDDGTVVGVLAPKMSKELERLNKSAKLRKGVAYP
ncbi:tape measure protein [Alkalibacterium sp. MB6]|uniref:tape measure protein n=1 Tax=Alkalibacterium sp. MB6 TaxID=2081965 RepID=UPI00137B39BD|nr:tape measure protein [Alkalibacterium sp. MB6]